MAGPIGSGGIDNRVYSEQMESSSLSPRESGGSQLLQDAGGRIDFGGFVTFIYDPTVHPAVRQTVPNLGIQVRRFAVKLDPLIVKQDFPLPHSNESLVFQAAINSLAGVRSAEDFLSNPEGAPNNVVLLDFYRRERNIIQSQAVYALPEAHTVCLWKRTNTRFVLVDPSNKDYSEGLFVYLKQQLSPATELEQHSCRQLCNYSRSSRGSGTGRDCIDIAVKIAYKLNYEQTIPHRQLDQIQDSIKTLSNVCATNSLIQANKRHYRQLVAENEEIRTSASALGLGRLGWLENENNKWFFDREGQGDRITSLTNWEVDREITWEIYRTTTLLDIQQAFAVTFSTDDHDSPFHGVTIGPIYK